MKSIDHVLDLASDQVIRRKTLCRKRHLIADWLNKVDCSMFIIINFVFLSVACRITDWFCRFWKALIDIKINWTSFGAQKTVVIENKMVWSVWWPSINAQQAPFSTNIHMNAWNDPWTMVEKRCQKIEICEFLMSDK